MGPDSIHMIGPDTRSIGPTCHHDEQAYTTTSKRTTYTQVHKVRQRLDTYNRTDAHEVIIEHLKIRSDDFEFGWI
jgi:hypothetical protein